MSMPLISSQRPLMPLHSEPEDTLDMSDDTTLILQPDALEIAESGAEELTQLRSMFASRRDFEKKRGSLEENYDQILEPDAADKVEKIVALAEVDGIAIDELLRYAQQLFPDESDLAQVLSELIRQYNKRKLAASASTLASVLDEVLRAANPKRLKAGINVALKARLSAAHLRASPARLRQCYRQFIENLELAASLYQSWISDFGAERRAQVLLFVESALYADMHAHDPSCTRIEFGALLANLRQLRMLRSCDERFVLSLNSSWQLEDSLSVLLLLTILQHPYDAAAVLPQLLGDRLDQVADRDRSILLQCLLSNFKSVPDDLFLVLGAREVLLDDLASMADAALVHEKRSAPNRLRAV